jgi:DNA sulfur modification protein DndD
MRIRSMTLQDVGLFRGRQSLDLCPRTKYGSSRPVVLVGGHNGAGKTTVIGALQLALYGRLALGSRVTDKEYHEHLRGLIHRRRDTLIPMTGSSVAVEFEHARAGTRSTYVVRRAWQLRDDRVDERLEVTRNGAPLTDVEAEFWPEFVRGLIPYGLSQLFFFDGEKIQRLAEDETESEALSESVKALLGLDLVERLQADLDVIVDRRVRTSGSNQVAHRLEEIGTRLTQIEASDSELEQREAQVRAQLDRSAAQVERLERKLAHSGKGLALRRDELHRRAGELKARLEAGEKQLRELCESALPFALCSRLATAVVQQLEKEAAAERWAATRQELDVVATDMRKRLGRRFRGSTRLIADARRVALAEVDAAFESIIAQRKDLERADPVHDVSEHGRGYLRQVLVTGSSEAAAKLADLMRDFLVNDEKLTSTQRRLNAVPDDEELAPLIKELSELQRRRGELSAQMTTIDEARQQLRLEREKIERERRKIIDAQEKQGAKDKQLALATSARKALDVYLERLTEAKVQRLQTEAVGCFKQLCRKDDLIASMNIDPRSFHVTLRDSRGRELPKSDLSAGEKQLYAVALLWGLARVSGRPLPMVIDTPLGRLDSVHRQNLVERYFPHASHQVVILSTDTEVDQVCFEALRSSTSHSIRLVHHQRYGWTEVSEGYFWKGETLAVANA